MCPHSLTYGPTPLSVVSLYPFFLHFYIYFLPSLCPIYIANTKHFFHYFGNLFISSISLQYTNLSPPNPCIYIYLYIYLSIYQSQIILLSIYITTLSLTGPPCDTLQYFLILLSALCGITIQQTNKSFSALSSTQIRCVHHFFNQILLWLSPIYIL